MARRRKAQHAARQPAEILEERALLSAVELVSGAADGSGAGANGSSRRASMSDDGRFVVFSSSATDLVPGQIDTPNTLDVFLHDRQLGTTSLITHTGDGVTAGNGHSFEESINGDGSTVVFKSRATDLVPGFIDNNGDFATDIFSSTGGVVSLVSHAAGSLTSGGNGSSQDANISADGDTIAYTSQATDLVAGFVNNNGSNSDIFKSSSGINSLVSHVPGNVLESGSSGSLEPIISADGSTVVFTGGANDLVTGFVGNVGGASHIFASSDGVVALVSRAASGANVSGDGISLDYVVNADGSVIAFRSRAENLVAGFVPNGFDDQIYVNSGGVVTLVSHAVGAPTTAGNRDSDWPTISADGTVVAFYSAATNLVAGFVDNNGNLSDVYSWSGGVTSLISGSAGSSTIGGDGRSFLPRVSADGSTVVFQSHATDLVAGVSANSTGDIYSVSNGVTTLISHNVDDELAEGNNSSLLGDVSADGAVVLFRSNASDLTPNFVDNNDIFDEAYRDVFVHQQIESPSLVVTTDLDVVDNTDNLTSLREAIAFANSDPDFSEITFGDGSGLINGTNFEDAAGDIITLGGSALSISSEVTISGPGADVLTVSGNDASRVFDIGNGNHDVTFDSLTIANGDVKQNPLAGGGIYNVSAGTMTIINTIITSNRATIGGGIHQDRGFLNIVRSELVDNKATFAGGGLAIGWPRFGAVVSISDSHISGNSSLFSNGTGIGTGVGGGIGLFRGVLSVTGTTIANNSAHIGGGIGTFHDEQSSVALVNSTVSANTASLTADGLISGVGGGISTNVLLTVTNSTVTGNTAEAAGGITTRLGSGGLFEGTAIIANSIVSGNTATTDNNIDGQNVTASNSLIDEDITTILDTNLADNGGATLTHALIPGSPAINAGDDSLAVDQNGDPLATDQRGENRFVGTVDIGAFEIQNLPPTADASGTYAVDEGSVVVLDGSASTDPNDAIADYEWDFNYDGTTFDVDATGATPNFTGIDDGTVTVALRVRDSFGAESDIVTTTVNVNNVDPATTGLTTDAASPETKSDDGIVTLSGSVTDAGTLDTHEVVVDWGDGTVETIVAAGDLVSTPDFSGTQHSYAAGGIYTVTVTVTDDDAGTVTETASAVVQGVGLVDGVLYIIGTNGDDKVTFKERHQGTQLKVRAKFDGGPTQNSYFDIADIDRIEMHLCDGDDYASLTHGHWWHQHSVDIPATINGGDGEDVLIGGSSDDVIDGGDGDDCLHGESGDDTIHGGDGHDSIDGDGGNDIVYAGAGNDHVWGGSGEDILLGQSGNDWLFGGWHRDIIIAGEGADRLFGQSYDDVLITGDTNWDNDESALKTVRDLWTGSGSAWNRALAIQDEGLEVFHDDDVDKAWGGWGLDWMLFDSEKDRVFC